MRIDLLADIGIVDQIIDWFGTDIRLSATGDGTKVAVSLKASPNAMEHWATQYIDHVEVTAPEHLRKRIQTALENAAAKYRK